MHSKTCLLTLLSLFFIAVSSSNTVCIAEEPTIEEKASTVLSEIMAGNQRFVENHAQHPHQSHQYIATLTKEQHPLVAILACSDSRVSPELIFDQGLGDIFDVRVAGNVADNDVIGSLEYAVEHLHVPLIIVLGHENCGAIAVTLAHANPHNHVNHIIHSLAPAIQHSNGSPEIATKNNVAFVLNQLQHIPVLEKAIRAGKLQIRGGYYHLESGQVELLSSSASNAH